MATEQVEKEKGQEAAETSPTAKMLAGKKGGGKKAGEKTEEKAAETTEAPKEKAQAPAKKEKVQTPEVLGADLIEAASKEVETLDKVHALELAKQLVNDTDFNYFKLGGVLAVIQANSWWEGSGHDSFKDFMQSEYGMPYRKGMYLIAIYNGLVGANIPWEKVKALGWTKLKELAGILSSENVDEWVLRAENMTTLQLIEYIKSSETPAPAGSSTTPGSNEVTTLTFKVHADQKQTVQDAVNKAKKENNTEGAAVALEYICMQYLEGGLGKAKKVTMEEMMQGQTPETVMAAFEKVFPHLNVTVEM